MACCLLHATSVSTLFTASADFVDSKITECLLSSSVWQAQNAFCSCSADYPFYVAGHDRRHCWRSFGLCCSHSLLQAQEASGMICSYSKTEEVLAKADKIKKSDQTAHSWNSYRRFVVLFELMMMLNWQALQLRLQPCNVWSRILCEPISGMVILVCLYLLDRIFWCTIQQMTQVLLCS